MWNLRDVRSPRQRPVLCRWLLPVVALSITNVDSHYGFAAPGGSWYTTVSKRCLNSNVEQWRSTWTEWPSSTPTVNLQCDT